MFPPEDIPIRTPTCKLTRIRKPARNNSVRPLGPAVLEGQQTFESVRTARTNTNEQPKRSLGKTSGNRIGYGMQNILVCCSDMGMPVSMVCLSMGYAPSMRVCRQYGVGLSGCMAWRGGPGACAVRVVVRACPLPVHSPPCSFAFPPAILAAAAPPAPALPPAVQPVRAAKHPRPEGGGVRSFVCPIPCPARTRPAVPRPPCGRSRPSQSA